MAKAKPRKKLAVPPGPKQAGKRTSDPQNLLPSGATSSERVSWRFTHVDHDGPWGFDRMDPALLCEILRKLAHFETMKISELRNTWRVFTEYDLPAAPLAKAAYDRLTAMGRDDMTRIARLELTGKQRLYGFLEGSVFHVVWWDPEHDIYPTTLRNT